MYSLVSVLGANVVFASALTLYQVLYAGIKTFASAGVSPFTAFFTLFLTYFAVSLGFSVLGWVLAVPLVVLAKRVDGWRFWMYLAFGAIFGPLLMIGVTVFNHLSGNNRGTLSQAFAVNPFAFAVSTLTSLIFLLHVRRGNHRAWVKQNLSIVNSSDR